MFTAHARDKMASDCISEEEVLGVLASPTVDLSSARPGSPNRRCFQGTIAGRHLRVVFDPTQDGGKKIISVYPL